MAYTVTRGNGLTVSFCTFVGAAQECPRASGYSEKLGTSASISWGSSAKGRYSMRSRSKKNMFEEGILLEHQPGFVPCRASISVHTGQLT